ncbi:DUF779 domain-containing protein [Novosphingobium mangrovi (ex Huang et al. 2023)]|uniref:DUF779 domain-containing protein n=1 Tax=Novosphingobium mangrovi (ex Huang et al. 2023) TaxID=2976432 RepID=A0ABT2I1T8_9SPHN|nr:DUF779 domain-containing protein [Novosphingobium mangrovi (ex Huang et al. 2023)]MCT2398769.1 DUF779 domain-containing protein [Novosphingobium mangrovi (ex Huang et al. 2023)]
MSGPVPPRILATPEAAAWIERLRAQHGDLMFHQSGGCCDGSAPMCFVAGEFRVGGQDVLLGRLTGDTPVWIGAAQFEYWRHTQVTIDVVPGRGAGMSLEAPHGVRFVIRSRVFTDEEAAALAEAGDPPRGDAVPENGERAITRE